MNGAEVSLSCDQRGTRGVRATLLAITLVTPVTAAAEQGHHERDGPEAVA